jgi:chromosome segregation ATPase
VNSFCLLCSQRLKGAIDSRIAEEQARQRAAALSGTPSRSNSGSLRRNAPQVGSPARQLSRQRERNDTSDEKGPDPSEFDADFVIGDDESAVPSRSVTPRPETSEKRVEGNETAGAAEKQQGADDVVSVQSDASTAAQRQEELPTEVRVRLRKLDRLESRYQDLLKAYRTAHTRVSLIEPFEASLRENTPLTSIQDPRALVEYLNQINLKGDMVLDELKRVTSERDDFKKKFEQSEQTTSELKNELETLKSQQKDTVATNGSGADRTPRPSLEVAAGATAREDGPESRQAAKSPTPSTSRVPSFSLFSPKSKAVKSPPARDTSEEFFSYDAEVPRLESELSERQNEVDRLTIQVENLKGDLSVARESTESMVQSLEAATRELHSLRDGKDKFESTQTVLQQTISELEAKVEKGEAHGVTLQNRIDNLQKELKQKNNALEIANNLMLEIRQGNGDYQRQIADAEKTAEGLRERLSQKEATVKDLEDSLAMYKSADRQERKSREADLSTEKRVETMRKVMDSLRSQLQSAETTVAELRQDLQAQQEAFKKRRSSKLSGYLDLENDPDIDSVGSKDDAINYLALVLDKHQDKSSNRREEVENITPHVDSVKQPGKKNKKKKKGKAGQPALEETAIHDVPVKVTEDLADAEEESSNGKTHSANHDHLERQIASLQALLEEKNSAVDRLTSQIRDQELLKEEIETLRDDLLHQGEEHVEARDALKAVQAEKTALQSSIEKLEKELKDGREKVAQAAESERAHKDLMASFEELKGKSATLQTDLAAAGQLASDRFKEITDLKEKLSKAQPELRSLRAEVQELKSTKEGLKNQTGELRRLEMRHEDLKSELKGLGKRLSDKDSEIKDLQQKVEQESSNRSKAEEDLRIAQSDLRFSEASRQDAIETSNQTSIDLAKAREDAAAMKSRLSSLEGQISNHSKEVTDLREEISLKASLYSSSQTLLQGLRDQTHELSIQAREATTRADSLDEELADAQRMLSERTREGETMRRLLNEVENKTESRLREMKERLETAVEERDRAEEEASTNARRLAREMEDLKTKARDAARALRTVEEEKEEFEHAQREWKRRREELEAANEKSIVEMGEVRTAMAQLREALDESERQTQDLERQKADLRRNGEEAQQRVERLTKANKSLTEELKVLQQSSRKASIRPGGGLDSGVQSSRSSIDSPGPNRTNSTVGSPAPNIRDKMPSSRGETPTGPNTPGIDYVYLKNVLLQFLEQKDKTHQKQLIPVLGMLLHFDR